MSTFSVIAFLAAREIEWENENGVSFLLLPGTKNGFGILISTTYPGFITDDDDIELDLSVEFENEEALYNEFPFDSVADVEQFSQLALSAAYARGIGTIACYTDTRSGQGLEFNRKGEAIVASEEGGSIMQKVWKALEGPEDYIEYTRSYFSKKDGKKGI